MRTSSPLVGCGKAVVERRSSHTDWIVSGACTSAPGASNTALAGDSSMR